MYQADQDRLWSFYQNEGIHMGRFSVPRQHYMLKQCRRGQSVLNIGVGAGTLERLALERGIDIHSLDPDVSTVIRLQNTLQMGDKARVGYSQDIPFETNRFDVVIMAEVIEHLEQDILEQSLREVLRVLKPSGYLVASTPYRENLEANQVLCPYCLNKYHQRGHVQSFDKPRLKGLLAEAGYHPVRLKVTTFVQWSPPHPMRLLKSAARLLLAHLGEPIADPHLVAKAYKPG